jgi:transcription-repair coupling factor (superfamily II helicase)
MEVLTRPLTELPQFRGILETMSMDRGPIGVNGMVDSACALFVHALAKETGKRCLLVTHSRMKAGKLYGALKTYRNEDLVYFPAREIMPFNIEAKSHGYESARVNALYKFATNDFKIAVAPVEALSIRLRKKEGFLSNIQIIEKGREYQRADLLHKLVILGYEKSDRVESEGMFSVRGDILDIFSPGSDNPRRIDFFGDEVERIKEFDPETQLSDKEEESFTILPCNEQCGSTEGIIGFLNKQKSLSANVQRDFDRIKDGLMHFPMDKYFGLENETDHALAYIDEDTIIIIDNDKRAVRKMEAAQAEYGKTYEKLLETKSALPESANMVAGFYEMMAGRKISIVIPDITGADEETGIYRSFSILTRENPSYGGRMDLLLQDIRKWRGIGRRVAIVAPSKRSSGIISEYLESNGIIPSVIEKYNEELIPGTVSILLDGPAEGFEILESALSVIGSGKIFRKSRKKEKKAGKTAGSEFFSDLKKGDFVVHDVHGIGRFTGIENIKAAGIRSDYMKVEYRNGDAVYIPVTKLDSIQKYIGSGGGAPRLSKMGGREWETTKAKVKKSVDNIARELVELYAKRKADKGFRYSPDTIWQVSFEEEFPYEETQDQLRCIDEIKEDMESDHIMERLLCGDVGYGKTEVALRAVFKAVMDGKQVAFLVPTTVLAYQHYRTFTERLKNFPVSTELMCRFRSKEQQKRTAAGLRAGSVDIVVGTHRLLQKDIVFKNLGLLVVDEEQRFGVEHKEKIKAFKSTIDVLTLTATPIPRTLHMSLSGIRDISLIEEPPAERFPVQTYVMEYDEDVVRDAVDREVARGGQVFYLYNRVRDMESKLAKLTSILGDDIRIGIAHGQMEENKLEAAMVDFVDGKYDVLLCTTIIESGLDIANVNTMIIEDADRMGLAQLYQIRGRVGRSDKVAYAYITHRHGKVITEAAAKRLEAIREFTEFGSGFKIAMRDLEIRGAGNLLGASQHGHMGQVGYDLYVRILNRAISRLTGKKEEMAEEKSDCTIDLNVNAFIDSEYIPGDMARMEMYKKIAIISDGSDRADLMKELEDRFGKIPEETAALLDIALLKNLASEGGVERVSRNGAEVRFEFRSGSFPRPEALSEISQISPGRILVSMGSRPFISFRNQSRDYIDMKSLITISKAINSHFEA